MTYAPICEFGEPRRPRTLIVEDDLFQRLQLQRVLQKEGFEVEACADGEQALVACQRQLPDMVITDWHLGEMSGVDLCAQLRAMPSAHRPHIILVTGSDRAEDIATGLAAGADDFLSKPWNSVELIARLRAGQRLVDLQHRLQDSSRELREALLRQQDSERQLRADLDAAVLLQVSLLERLSMRAPGLRSASLFVPATDLSGDLHGLLNMGAPRVGFYQIDIEGHSVSSALSSFALVSTLESYEQLPDRLVDPAGVVAELNARILANQPFMPSCTIVLGWVDVNSGEGRFCQAGHPHPVLRAPGRVQALGDGGLPVGLLPQAPYQNVDFRLQPGEQLLLYSDGLPDCQDREGEALGSERLIELFGRIDAPLDRYTAEVGVALERWRGGAPRADDMSLLVLEIDA